MVRRVWRRWPRRAKKGGEGRRGRQWCRRTIVEWRGEEGVLEGTRRW